MKYLTRSISPSSFSSSSSSSSFCCLRRSIIYSTALAMVILFPQLLTVSCKVQLLMPLHSPASSPVDGSSTSTSNSSATAASSQAVLSTSTSTSTSTPPAVAIKVPFTSCGGNVHEVRAHGCQKNALPCYMTRGSVGRVEVDFTAPFDARSLYADVRGRTGPSLVPVYVPLAGFHKEACIGHGITCPVKKGTRQTYIYEMIVDNSLPNMKTDAIWKLTDYWGFTVACFKTDINIS